MQGAGINVHVTFYSRGGLTQRIAVWFAEGALQAGANIRLRRARDIAAEEMISANPEWKDKRDRMHEEFAAPTRADAEWADVLAFGAPAGAGVLSPELCAYLDQFRGQDLEGKVGTAFTSGYLPTAGGESTIVHLQLAMLGLGLTVMPYRMRAGTTKSENADWELAHEHGRRAAAAMHPQRI